MLLAPARLVRLSIELTNHTVLVLFGRKAAGRKADRRNDGQTRGRVSAFPRSIAPLSEFMVANPLAELPEGVCLSAVAADSRTTWASPPGCGPGDAGDPHALGTDGAPHALETNGSGCTGDAHRQTDRHSAQRAGGSATAGECGGGSSCGRGRQMPCASSLRQLSAAPACSSMREDWGGGGVRERPDGLADAWAEFRVPPAVMAQSGVIIDIVTPGDRRCNCFTRTYSKYAKVMPRRGGISLLW
jgi:hypothetical protein